MKRIRRWFALLTVVGSAVVVPSCPGMLGRELRDAALSGASTFIQQLTIELLEQRFLQP